MSDDNSGPAFPETDYYHERPVSSNSGMSLRDYFAAKALPSTLSASASGDGNYDYVAAIGAYLVADAMLNARKP